jgi:phage terminase Nu1 subunit (DNA packaging protein)
VILNRAQLADVFGVSLPTVDSWVRAGCPIERKGSRGVQAEFDSAKVAKWLRDRALADATGDQQQDLDEIERRTKRARMRQAELEVAKEMGLVAPIREFERVQAARFAVIRQNVLNVARRAALQLLGETREDVFKAKLTAELKLALESAANAELDLPPEEADADA